MTFEGFVPIFCLRHRVAMPAFRALSHISTRSVANAASPPALNVVCAFPLSSNYGPGSRVRNSQRCLSTFVATLKGSLPAPDPLLCPCRRMCDFPKGRMVAECLLGCRLSSSSYCRNGGPRARLRSCKWSVLYPPPTLPRDLV